MNKFNTSHFNNLILSHKTCSFTHTFIAFVFKFTPVTMLVKISGVISEICDEKYEQNHWMVYIMYSGLFQSLLKLFIISHISFSRCFL